MADRSGSTPMSLAVTGVRGAHSASRPSPNKTIASVTCKFHPSEHDEHHWIDHSVQGPGLHCVVCSLQARRPPQL
ncbi:hypothetical protein L226DRAFT_392479 [Lentinus tigrinus ALCF2SS1-7]|uniref:uncharacterized protein n=1 Tax=Lentinus tigrinus ALCF2SS1-7 TaxID=1328758 RepID=UPI001165D973|nr:hypothetical protein L226DRAFT_392479 [Lentinus tigrinus ALCF2SS1-7]